MARYGVAVFIMAIAMGLQEGTAATLYSDKDSVVRREPSSSVQLDGRGWMAELDKSSPKKDDAAQWEDKTVDAASAKQFCNIDFAMGPSNSTSCSGVGTVMIDPGWCEEAANLSGVEYGPEVVTNTGHRLEYKHPKGCFKDSCGSSSSKSACYFYNPIDELPEVSNPEFSGQIVCWRHKHAHGTPDKHGGCPSGYQVIDDEWQCRESAECLDYVLGSPFNIGGGSYANASKHREYVRGCLYLKEDGVTKVYYNAPNEMGEGPVTKGTNLCNVSSTIALHGGHADIH